MTTPVRVPSDNELIAAGERILAGLQELEHNVSRDLRRVAWCFGVPFFLLVSPLIYDSFVALVDPLLLALASMGIAISTGVYGWYRWRRKQPRTHVRDH